MFFFQILYSWSMSFFSSWAARSAAPAVGPVGAASVMVQVWFRCGRGVVVSTEDRQRVHLLLFS